MVNQKDKLIPTVSGIEVSDYAATDNFTTDPIEFPNSDKDWSIDITIDNTSGETVTLSITDSGANLDDGVYVDTALSSGDDASITVSGNEVTAIVITGGDHVYTSGEIVTPLAPGLPPFVAEDQPSFTATFPTAVTDSTLTILVCNEQDGEYKEYKTISTDIDLSVEGNLAIFDKYMPFKFMKLDYTAGTSTGGISINICK